MRCFMSCAASCGSYGVFMRFDLSHFGQRTFYCSAFGPVLRPPTIGFRGGDLARSAVRPATGLDRDRAIRLAVLDRLGEQHWTDFGSRNVTVTDGVVHLWGLVGSAAEHEALLALVEGIEGVKGVSDETFPAY
jgi:hypothetical protein